MAKLIPDTIDFSAYMEQTEPRIKVKPASKFSAELLAEFAQENEATRAPSMISTKMRDAIRFRPGESTVWAGYNGHRKSMVTGQVALDLCFQKQRVLMASFEMTPARTLGRMARQCFAVAKPASQSLEAFAHWTDGKLWIFDHQGRIGVDLCLAVCRYFASELQGTQIVLDSMMMVCNSEERLDEQKQFATAIVRLAQETGLHVHLVAHCRKPQTGEDKIPTKYDLRGSASITDQFDNVVTVWSNKAKIAALNIDPMDETATAQPDAALTIEKQRNGAFEGRFRMWWCEQSLRFSNDRMSPIEPYALGGITV